MTKHIFDEDCECKDCTIQFLYNVLNEIVEDFDLLNDYEVEGRSDRIKKALSKVGDEC